MSQSESRNPTYQRLRAPARQGTYTVGQLIGLAVSGLLAFALAAVLMWLGAPVGLSLTAGILLAGLVPMAALALEGREFSVLAFLRAAIAWQRAPRHFLAEPGAPRSGAYHLRETNADDGAPTRTRLRRITR